MSDCTVANGPHLVQRGVQAVGVVLHFAALADDDALGVIPVPASRAGCPRHEGPAGSRNICDTGATCLLRLLRLSNRMVSFGSW